MGVRKMGLLFMLLCHLYFPAAPSPHRKTLPSVLLQENNFKDKEMEKNSNSSGSAIVRRDNVSHRGGGGGGHANGGGGGHANGGGRSSGHGENGSNGGESTNPSTAGGTAVIPIYAAGAAGGHHPNNNHHSAGSWSRSFSRLPTLGAAIFATLALHINVVFRLEN